MPTTNSEWGFNTTAQTVAAAYPDAIKNRTILITGVNRNGLGYATAAALASQSPSTIIITGRSQAKLDESLASLRTAYPSVTFKPLVVDLSSQASVRSAAASVLAWPDILTLDIVINNAGVMNLPSRTLSVDGIEMHFATNHIGHFLLTNLLMPKILASTAPRIVNVSSIGTFVSPVRFSDLLWNTPHAVIPEQEKPNVGMLAATDLLVTDDTTYIPFGAYGLSKTANILFSVGLNKKVGGKGVRSFALHPGEIMTDLHRTTDPAWLAMAKERGTKVGLKGDKSAEEGAATSVVAAVDPGLGGEKEGVFLEDCQVSAKVPSYAVDEKEAERLWEVSEGLVGEKFAW
ncbi:NAD(P)-binding protein [Karstenula rhodostoma CBS 690.94]|uniref:NAD(P)-binding protein n=1 Tax=Karstenula rhodostoma CBS 690.94 TaxID=1392251 RepID=A0A9P4PEN1_9PLEO|nr:NAD(P)-binding protein [Karstenula rhodostoma CBS 690.94]